MNISVIIPVFERRDLIARALASVAAQSLPASEIIVVDDGSSDGTADAVRRNFPRVKLIRQPHRGVSAARNCGIKRAAGDWIALLDSDDEWRADKLQAQAAELARQPAMRFCHSDEIWIRGGRRVNPKARHAKFGGWIFDKCLPLCCISPSSALIHRSVFERVGGFDESLPVCEDYDLWLRITCRYPVLLAARRLVVKHGGHDRQLSRQYWGMDRFRVRALDNLLDTAELNADQSARAAAALLDKIAILRNGFRKRGNRRLDEYYRRLALRRRPPA